MNCVIELEIECKENEEKNFYTYMHPDLSAFSTELEVLLKSGDIIKFIAFNYYKNSYDSIKYIFRAKVLSLDLRDFQNYIIQGIIGKRLNLHNNSIGKKSEDIKYLAEALKENKTITHLDLRNNSIGENSEEIKNINEIRDYNNIINIFLIKQ